VDNYKPIYIRLFSRTEDAILALEGGNAKIALQILITAQQEAEELVLRIADE